MKYFLIACFSLGFVLQCSEPEQKPTTKEAVSASDDVNIGKQLFMSNNCNGCHGDTGLGDGPAGQALNPKPRVFKDIYSYRKGHSEDQITAMLEFGLEGSPMKGYSHLSPVQRRHIAKYVVWLQKQP
ncbi:MAG: cytochrome c [Spirochaetia bacterium]|nr:cytochrome c [Spirochaetia bacterium]